VPQAVEFDVLQDLIKPHGEHPGAQVLVCTHSRHFFDVVAEQPSVLRLVRRGADGRSTVENVPGEVVPSVAGWAGLT